MERCAVAMGVADVHPASRRWSFEHDQGPISPLARLSGHTTPCGGAVRVPIVTRESPVGPVATPKRWKYSPAGSFSTTVLRPLIATNPACQIHRYRKRWKRITAPSPRCSRFNIQVFKFQASAAIMK